MKNFCLNTVLAAGLFASASLPSRAENIAQVDFVAPFAFHVGAATLPPGAYRIMDSTVNGTVFIMAAQGYPSAVAIIGDFRTASQDQKAKVTFLQREGQLFLSSFSRGDGRIAEISRPSPK